MRFEVVEDGKNGIQVVTEEEKLEFEHIVLSRGNSLLAGNKRVKVVQFEL